MTNNSEFVRFWNGLRNDAQTFGPCVNQFFSFSNRLIDATFRFTFFILDFLGRINTVFQERFRVVVELWDMIMSLKALIDSFIVTPNTVLPTKLECLTGLSDDDVDMFHYLLIELKRALDLRFPRPSTSFDLKCRRYSKGPTVSEIGKQQFIPPNCGVMPLVELYGFLQRVLGQCTSTLMVNNEILKQEVENIYLEIRFHINTINSICQERCTRLSQLVGIPIVSPVNLNDVFGVVRRESYPLLWREIMKINSIFATTVCCEQCFSVVKRSIHVNMKTNTFVANVVNKLHEGSKRKYLTQDETELSDQEPAARNPGSI